MILFSLFLFISFLDNISSAFDAYISSMDYFCRLLRHYFSHFHIIHYPAAVRFSFSLIFDYFRFHIISFHFLLITLFADFFSFSSLSMMIAAIDTFISLSCISSYFIFFTVIFLFIFFFRPLYFRLSCWYFRIFFHCRFSAIFIFISFLIIITFSLRFITPYPHLICCRHFID